MLTNEEGWQTMLTLAYILTEMLQTVCSSITTYLYINKKQQCTYAKCIPNSILCLQWLLNCKVAKCYSLPFYWAFCVSLLPYWFVCVASQVLLGLDNAHHDDGESNHHSCGNNLLLRADYHHLAGLQCGLGHHLHGGPGHELQNGDRQWGELWNHPWPQGHQDELSEELVRCGLPFLHPSGLYLFNSGERLWFGGI